MLKPVPHGTTAVLFLEIFKVGALFSQTTLASLEWFSKITCPPFKFPNKTVSYTFNRYRIIKRLKQAIYKYIK